MNTPSDQPECGNRAPVTLHSLREKILGDSSPDHAGAPTGSTAAVEAAAALDEATVCPECGGPLSGSSRWCARCGYCGYLKESARPPEERTASTLGLADLFKAAAASEWLPVLACGLVIIGVGSMIAWMNVHQEPRARSIWCLSQTSLGVVIFSLGVVWSLRGPGEHQPFQSLFASAFWIALWERLPDTCWPVYLITWGTFCAFMGVLILLL